MKKRLSTSMTFFWKFIFSGLWLGGFTIGSIMAMTTLGFEGLVFLVGLVFGFLLLYYACLRAKVVHIDETTLYVSNFRKKIEVPIRDIKSVHENIMFSPRPIFVEFKKETEFGNGIMFIGTFEMILFFSTHPSVKEIKYRMR